MSAAAIAPTGLGVTVQARAVTFACARKWPMALDGRSVRPVRGTWHPHLVRVASDGVPFVVPLVACPRCAHVSMLVLDSDSARILQRKEPLGRTVTPSHSVNELGVVAPELRCAACGWYAVATLGQWNQWQTLYCAMVLEGGDPLMRPLYTHAADELQARESFARRGRRIVSVSVVIRDDSERRVLL